MLKCYIVGRNLVNGSPKIFDIAEGAVFSDNFNETLDNGTIILPQLDEEIEIDSYDTVVIYSDNNSINQRILKVDTFTCYMTCLVPPIYNYEISLFSETKGLEGILLPSLAITKRFIVTRSVYHYLMVYLSEYNDYQNSSPLLGPTSGKYSFGTNLFDINDTVFSRFANIDCPEMQWNNPTLREVINDLMMVDDCIPVVRNNVINFIDIGEKGSEITDVQKKKINYLTKSQSSEDYVSELKMHLQNVTSNQKPTGSYDSIESENLPSEITEIVEEIGFRNSEAYIIDDEKLRVETSHPIWNLLYCAMVLNVTYGVTAYDEDDNVVLNQTITLPCEYVLKDSTYDYILEYGEWQTKEVRYSGFGGTEPLNTDYQNTCLFYQRGGNIIGNFEKKQEVLSPLFIPSQVSVYELIINDELHWQASFIRLLHEQYPITIGCRLVFDSNPFPEPLEGEGGFKFARFKVAYQSVSECVFLASKTPFAKNKRQVIDNQTNSYIDINRVGMLEYLKANRLGNKLMIANGRYNNESELPGLSQTIFDDFIIFSRQITVYDSYIDISMQLTENYVLRDYFTGIKSKLRSWKIIDGNEAFTRADIIKFFVNENISPIDNTTYKLPVYDDLDDYLNNFRYCAIKFNLEDSTELPNTDLITDNVCLY